MYLEGSLATHSKRLHFMDIMISYASSWKRKPTSLPMVGNTALYYACARGYADMFHTLVKAGANVYTYHSPYSSCDDDSETSSETSQRVEV